MWETWVQSLGREDPLEKAMATHSVLLPRKSHGQRSLIGYSPWGRKELDTTERLHFTSSLPDIPVLLKELTQSNVVVVVVHILSRRQYH